MSKYVVYDLEMCKVPKGTKREEFGSRQELIQIGAVMLDEEYKTVDTFMKQGVKAYCCEWINNKSRQGMLQAYVG